MDKAVILLVDDEPAVTGGLKRGLAREPLEVLCASGGVEALEVMESRPVDVVVTDDRMPGMNGSQLLARVCERHPDVVRIMLTGHASLESATRAINQGYVFRFLTKPCSASDLIASIRQGLQIRRLSRSGRALLGEYRRQSAVLDALERDNPGITRVVTDEGGAILLDDTEGDVESLLAAMQDELERARRSPADRP